MAVDWVAVAPVKLPALVFAVKPVPPAEPPPTDTRPPSAEVTFHILAIALDANTACF